MEHRSLPWPGVRSWSTKKSLWGRAVFAAAMTVTLFLGNTSFAFNGFSANGDNGSYPDSANGRMNSAPYIHAHQITNAKIKLDGKLDDAVWANAEGGRGFLVWDPDRGTDPSEETVFKVAYDGGGIYFAVACLENDPANIAGNLARRDRFSNSDLVSIYIDPYFDKNTGYNFKVNPLGVKVDAYMYNNGDRDEDWNCVWDAETFQDERGWYAEIYVPFSSIRYRPSEEMTWGLQVYRYMHTRGEDTSWVTWDRELNGFISRFGELRGLREVKNPRQLEMRPYILGKSQDYAEPDFSDSPEQATNMGLDMKYGVTADLTLNATANPDFGHVESDPAVLNLSPFENFFEEKRPFFVEGSRFFRHPDFNMFYSRRIGLGDPSSRIRAAGKMTGKTKNGVSLGLLAAHADLASSGRHIDSMFKKGTNPETFLISRVGKEFNEGNQSFNVMGTYAHRDLSRGFTGYDGSDSTAIVNRDAVTAGLDFDLYWKDRTYNIQGSAVASDISDKYSGDKTGHGGNLDVRKVGGNFRGGTWGRWESDKLDINDVGFLSAPDEMNTGLWGQWRYNPEGESKTFNQARVNLNYWYGWLYGARTGYDVDTDEEAWSYGAGLPQETGGNVNGWMQFRNYYDAWWGISYNHESRNRWGTRGGPLMREPTTYGGWYGAGTDSRKQIRFNLDGNYFADRVGNNSANIFLGMRWRASSALDLSLNTGFRNRHDDTEWLENVTLSDRPGSDGTGIGGISYVFGRIHQQTLDITLRSSVLFTRDQSLDIYLQPFMTTGDYTNARELARADSYDFFDYSETRSDGSTYRAEDSDFSYTALNFNLVYRWEFRPASTLFLVWTHAKETFDQRIDNGPGYENNLGVGDMTNVEGENLFMAKISYWFNL